MKRINPYTRLLNEIKTYCSKIKRPEKKLMFFYPAKKLRTNDTWCLADLSERTNAARVLGYDVKLESTERGLEVWYVKKPPLTPMDWSY